MKTKRVIFFIYELGSGGAARTFLNIINNINRDKITPILVTLNYNGSYETYLDKDVKFIKLNTKRLRSAIIPLSKIIRQEKADIVFSTIPNYNTIAIVANLLSFSGAKNIVREAAFLGGNKKADVKLRIYGALYKLAEKVIALSHGVKKNIENRYLVDPKKIQVIYNPVDIKSIQQRIKTGVVPREYEWIFNKEDKIIITAGRLVEDKDHKTLIQAFAKVNKKIKCKLVILGEGKLKEELIKLTTELQIEDRVYFVGFQENPYIYFHKADLFVLSSLREGFGHVLTEALASETPVVSTNCKPGAVEVLENGIYGKLCEIGNPNDMAEKIEEILTLNDNERKAIIQKGLKRVNEFHAKKIVKQYEDMFIEVIEGNRR